MQELTYLQFCQRVRAGRMVQFRRRVSCWRPGDGWAWLDGGDVNRGDSGRLWRDRWERALGGRRAGVFVIDSGRIIGLPADRPSDV